MRECHERCEVYGGSRVDGTGWEGVYRILRKGGYDVLSVQNPTLNLADDVVATRQMIARRTARQPSEVQ